MNRRHVQWVAIGFPAVLVGAFEFVRHPLLEHQLPGSWGNVAGALLVATAVYGFIRYFIGVVTRTEKELGRSRAEAEVLSERQRLAREMHDSVAQALFSLGVQLQDMDRHAARGDLTRVREEIAHLTTQVNAAYNQVRVVISDLKQLAAHEETGEALRRTAGQVGRALGLDVEVHLSDMPGLDAKRMHHLLAIVSEAMTNASRHGQATHIKINGDRRRLTIEDNGSGFEPAKPTGNGFGLLIMAERATMLGGQLEVRSGRAKGTGVILAWEGQPQ